MFLGNASLNDSWCSQIRSIQFSNQLIIWSCNNGSELSQQDLWTNHLLSQDFPRKCWFETQKWFVNESNKSGQLSMSLMTDGELNQSDLWTNHSFNSSLSINLLIRFRKKTAWMINKMNYWFGNSMIWSQWFKVEFENQINRIFDNSSIPLN